jgi:hypothetical protein
MNYLNKEKSKKMEQVFYTRHDGGVTLMRNGKKSTVASSHPNFSKIVKALSEKCYEKLDRLMNVAKTITQHGSCKHGKIFVENGKVFYTDTRRQKTSELHGSLVDRIIRDIDKPGCEKYAMSLMNLLENIQKNPLKDISGELYEWLSSGKAPITVDGCVLAYKKVRRDFKDHYTGKVDNSPGNRVWMKQSDVDTNRLNECSVGLHFCSLGYLNHYAGDESNSRVVIVKVNPRHIFAIPKYYSFQKGRASEYIVVGEYVAKGRESMEAFADSFIDEDNKLTAAPNVNFAPGGLRESLETIAEGFDLVRDGKVKISTLPATNGLPIDWDSDQKDFIVRSFKTKTVRSAVKKVVDKLRAGK